MNASTAESPPPTRPLGVWLICSWVSFGIATSLIGVALAGDRYLLWRSLLGTPLRVWFVASLFRLRRSAPLAAGANLAFLTVVGAWAVSSHRPVGRDVLAMLYWFAVLAYAFWLRSRRVLR
jgi:hypothetical protein